MNKRTKDMVPDRRKIIADDCTGLEKADPTGDVANAVIGPERRSKIAKPYQKYLR